LDSSVTIFYKSQHANAMVTRLLGLNCRIESTRAILSKPRTISTYACVSVSVSRERRHVNVSYNK